MGEAFSFSFYGGQGNSGRAVAFFWGDAGLTSEVGQNGDISLPPPPPPDGGVKLSKSGMRSGSCWSFQNLMARPWADLMARPTGPWNGLGGEGGGVMTIWAALPERRI